MQKPQPHSVLNWLSLLFSWLPFAAPAQAGRLLVGQSAPIFELKAQNGNPIRLAARQGQSWTVLYFYPKAETPGCIKQACAFRDAIQVVRHIDDKVDPALDAQRVVETLVRLQKSQ